MASAYQVRSRPVSVPAARSTAVPEGSTVNRIRVPADAGAPGRSSLSQNGARPAPP
jgi:hypothetical protein